MTVELEDTPNRGRKSGQFGDSTLQKVEAIALVIASKYRGRLIVSGSRQLSPVYSFVRHTVWNRTTCRNIPVVRGPNRHASAPYAPPKVAAQPPQAAAFRSSSSSVKRTLTM
jgi:hypothetical protein